MKPYLVRQSNRGGRPTVYHTDAECKCLKKTDPHAVGYSFVKSRGLRECHECAGRCDRDRSEQYRALRVRIEQGEVEV